MKNLLPPLKRAMKGLMGKYLPGMISCQEFEAFIVHYLDDELNDQEKAIFESHLNFCKECREYLKAYKQTVALGKAAFANPETPIPLDVPEELIKAMLQAKQKQ
jgi:anti-sigma factor RsiW